MRLPYVRVCCELREKDDHLSATRLSELRTARPKEPAGNVVPKEAVTAPLSRPTGDPNNSIRRGRLRDLRVPRCRCRPSKAARRARRAGDPPPPSPDAAQLFSRVFYWAWSGSPRCPRCATTSANSAVSRCPCAAWRWPGRQAIPNPSSSTRRSCQSCVPEAAKARSGSFTNNGAKILPRTNSDNEARPGNLRAPLPQEPVLTRSSLVSKLNCTVYYVI